MYTDFNDMLTATTRNPLQIKALEDLSRFLISVRWNSYIMLWCGHTWNTGMLFGTLSSKKILIWLIQYSIEQLEWFLVYITFCMMIDSNVWIYHHWCTIVYMEMWLKHICIEYTRWTVHHFCHFQFLILVLSHEVTVWSCRKKNVNRYSEQILLVSGLWIYGTLCLRRLCLLQMWIVWGIDLIVTVSISDTATTEMISSFNDQSLGLSGLS